MAQGEMNWDDCIQQAAVTDMGMRRTSNQDAYATLPAADLQNWLDQGHLFLIADGMGAHAGGELASRLAADGIPHTYYTHRDKSPPDAIQTAITETNTQINQRGEANTDFHNMGTTASVLLLLPQGALAAHVGDSRVYRLRGDQIEQLTFDHSLVWEMRAAGKFPKNSDLSSMLPKNVITRSLGPNPTVQVDLEGPLPIELGDTFLLCSDGLSGRVDDDEMGALMGVLTPQEAAQTLVDLANLRGGPDNITVIVVKVVSDQLTTRVSDDQPWVVGSSRGNASLHPLLWAIMGLCLLSAGFMFAAARTLPALVMLAVGAVTALIVVFQKLGMKLGQSETGSETQRRFGKGPHTRTTCPPNDEFVVRLDRLAKELMAAAKKWKLDLSHFDEFCASAHAATASQNYPEAIRQYARGISQVMRQLSEEGREASANSTLGHFDSGPPEKRV